MKKLSIFLIAIVAILSLNACSDDDDFTFTAKENPEGVMFLNSTADVYSLSALNRDNLAERFVWNEVDFDVQTTVRYELQASTTPEFTDLTILASNIAETNYGVTVGNMLDLATEAGLDNDPDTDAPNSGMLYFRVRAYVGESPATDVSHVSEVLTIMVELPEDTDGAEPAKLQFYMVGDASAAGWNPDNNNTPLFRDATDENIYYFTGRFAGGDDVEGFKLLETLGQWQPQWGLNEGSFTSSDILGGDPSAFPVTADQYYTLEVNRDALTYSFEAYDASADATYDAIGITGDATPGGWPGDDNPAPDSILTKSEFDAHIWYIKGVELGDGEMKFRADTDWTNNWGADTALSGQAVQDGANIPVAAGTYDVWFNDITHRYILIPAATE